VAFSRIDKINVLTALDLNDGKITKTAEEFGLDRGTIYNWQKQLDKDVKLLKQVQAAKENLANIEELTAIKALSEINKRLDMTPECEKTQDLLKIKDSGINNSRLIRGQTTDNIGVSVNIEAILSQFRRNFPDADNVIQAEYLRAFGGELGLRDDVIEVECRKLINSESQSNI
jgi:transposase-like protein